MLTLLLTMALGAQPEAKAEMVEVPANFVEYFEKAAEEKSKILLDLEGRVEQAKIVVRSSTAFANTHNKKHLAANEANLKSAKKIGAFAYIDPRKVVSLGVFFASRDTEKPSEQHNVLGVVDKNTLVANCVGVDGMVFSAVLKVDSTKGITAADTVGTKDLKSVLRGESYPVVWHVISHKGLDDPRVAGLVEIKDARPMPVLRAIGRLELEKYRKAYDAAKKVDVDKPSP